MSNTTSQTRGQRILFYYIAFFLVIAVINGIMVTIAIRTHTGLVTDHPYEQGLAYNQVVQAASMQEKKAWRGIIDFRQTGRQKGVLSFQLTDQSGNALVPDFIRATCTRPTQQGLDFSVTFEGPNSAIAFPVNGVWNIRIYARHQGADYQQSKRIVVK